MNNCRRVIVHIHHIVGMGNFHTLRQIGNTLAFQHIQNFLATTYQHHLGAEFLDGIQCAQHRCLGRIVATHCIHNNLHT